MQPAKHYFAGGNTSQGFFSYFRDVLPGREARRGIYLKGGPGVGKNMFMRRIGLALEGADQAVEYIHCASDPESLDGVICRDLGFFIVDGTAPHVLDPVVPGSVDGILNLGVFLHEEALAPYCNAIGDLMEEISQCYARAYCYLKAAAPLYEDAARTLQRVTQTETVEKLAAPWFETITNHRAIAPPGQRRRLFAEAYTHRGLVQYMDSLALPRLWRLSGPWAGETSPLLERLADTALLHGLDVDCCMDPTFPGMIRHLAIPALGLFVTTEEDVRLLPYPAERSIDLRVAQPDTELFSQQILRALALDRMTFEHLCNQAMESLEQAKLLHDHLEKYYVERMDFQASQALLEKTLETLERMVEAQEKS